MRVAHAHTNCENARRSAAAWCVGARLIDRSFVVVRLKPPAV